MNIELDEHQILTITQDVGKDNWFRFHFLLTRKDIENLGNLCDDHLIDENIEINN